LVQSPTTIVERSCGVSNGTKWGLLRWLSGLVTDCRNRSAVVADKMITSRARARMTVFRFRLAFVLSGTLPAFVTPNSVCWRESRGVFYGFALFGTLSCLRGREPD